MLLALCLTGERGLGLLLLLGAQLGRAGAEHGVSYPKIEGGRAVRRSLGSSGAGASGAFAIKASP